MRKVESVERVCRNCGCTFYVKITYLKDERRGLFCSMDCLYVGRRPVPKRIASLICEVCSEGFNVPEGRKDKARFCSYKCMGVSAQRANEEVLRKSATTHGQSKSMEFRRWMHMRQRCRDDYHYVARGIKVCARWDDSFPAFLVDMGSMPTPSHTLDRYPDNDGDYEPGNVRWALPSEQGWSKVGVAQSKEHVAKRTRRGESNGMTKLTEAIVHAIRSVEGKERISVTARRLGVSYGIVYDVQRRRTWAWLD